MADESDFGPPAGTGPYTYSHTFSGLSDGTYTVELVTAENDGTPSGDTPRSGAAVVGGGGNGVNWETPGDWDDATTNDGSFVHASYGDHDPGRIELGYSQNAPGLVSYWPLDDATGGADDVTGTNDGTLRGSPTSTNGIGNSTAYRLNPSDSDDYVAIPDSSSLEMGDNDAVTVSMWVNKQDAQKSQTWVAMFQHSDRSYNLQFNNGNEPEFTIHDDGVWTDAGIDNGLGANQWFHLVGTYDGTELVFYRDGVRADSVCQEGAAGASGNCRGGGDMDETDEPAGIGENIDTRNGGDERTLDGKVDEIRLYDRALSDSEVKALYDTFQRGTFTTEFKTAGAALDADATSLQYDVESGPNEQVEVKVVTDSGDESDWITVPDGSGSTGVTGLSTDDDTVRLRVRLTSTVPTESPSVTRLGVTG
jgi:hypothetical protein